MRDLIEVGVEQQGLGSHVVLMGGVEDAVLRGFLQRGDLFVLPVLEVPGDVEGFGIVFLEAALGGMPSVATRVGGIPEAIAHNESGILVEPGDWDAMVVEIGALLRDEALRKRLAESGAKRARALFSWEAITAQYMGVFNRVAGLK